MHEILYGCLFDYKHFYVSGVDFCLNFIKFFFLCLNEDYIKTRKVYV